MQLCDVQNNAKSDKIFKRLSQAFISRPRLTFQFSAIRFEPCEHHRSTELSELEVHAMCGNLDADVWRPVFKNVVTRTRFIISLSPSLNSMRLLHNFCSGLDYAYVSSIELYECGYMIVAVYDVAFQELWRYAAPGSFHRDNNYSKWEYKSVTTKVNLSVFNNTS